MGSDDSAANPLVLRLSKDGLAGKEPRNWSLEC